MATTPTYESLMAEASAMLAMGNSAGANAKYAQASALRTAQATNTAAGSVAAGGLPTGPAVHPATLGSAQAANPAAGGLPTGPAVHPATLGPAQATNPAAGDPRYGATSSSFDSFDPAAIMNVNAGAERSKMVPIASEAPAPKVGSAGISVVMDPNVGAARSEPFTPSAPVAPTYDMLMAQAKALSATGDPSKQSQAYKLMSQARAIKAAQEAEAAKQVAAQPAAGSIANVMNVNAGASRSEVNMPEPIPEADGPGMAAVMDVNLGADRAKVVEAEKARVDEVVASRSAPNPPEPPKPVPTPPALVTPPTTPAPYERQYTSYGSNLPGGSTPDSGGTNTAAAAYADTNKLNQIDYTNKIKTPEVGSTLPPSSYGSLTTETGGGYTAPTGGPTASTYGSAPATRVNVPGSVLGDMKTMPGATPSMDYTSSTGQLTTQAGTNYTPTTANRGTAPTAPGATPKPTDANGSVFDDLAKTGGNQPGVLNGTAPKVSAGASLAGPVPIANAGLASAANTTLQDALAGRGNEAARTQTLAAIQRASGQARAASGAANVGQIGQGGANRAQQAVEERVQGTVTDALLGLEAKDMERRDNAAKVVTDLQKHDAETRLAYDQMSSEEKQFFAGLDVKAQTDFAQMTSSEKIAAMQEAGATQRTVLGISSNEKIADKQLTFDYTELDTGTKLAYDKMTSEEKQFFEGLDSQERLGYAKLTSDEKQFFAGLTSEERRDFAKMASAEKTAVMQEAAATGRTTLTLSSNERVSDKELGFKYSELDTNTKLAYDQMTAEEKQFFANLKSEEQRDYANLNSKEKMFYNGLRSEERRAYTQMDEGSRQFYAGLDVQNKQYFANLNQEAQKLEVQRDIAEKQLGIDSQKNDLEGRRVRVLEDNEQSRQYWDTAQKFSTAVQANAERPGYAESGEFLAQASQWYEAKYGVEPSTSDPNFKQWAKAELEAAKGDHLTNPYDETINTINKSTELSPEAKKVMTQLMSNPEVIAKMSGMELDADGNIKIPEGPSEDEMDKASLPNMTSLSGAESGQTVYLTSSAHGLKPGSYTMSTEENKNTLTNKVTTTYYATGKDGNKTKIRTAERFENTFLDNATTPWGYFG